jgi:hypothetical protein
MSRVACITRFFSPPPIVASRAAVLTNLRLSICMPDWTLHHPADRLIWQAPDVFWPAASRRELSSLLCCGGHQIFWRSQMASSNQTKWNNWFPLFKQLILRATASFWAVLMEAKKTNSPAPAFSCTPETAVGPALVLTFDYCFRLA